MINQHAHDIVIVLITTCRLTGFDAQLLHGMAEAIECDDPQAALAIAADMAKTHGRECQSCLDVLCRVLKGGDNHGAGQ